MRTDFSDHWHDSADTIFDEKFWHDIDLFYIDD